MDLLERAGREMVMLSEDMNLSPYFHHADFCHFEEHQ